MIDELRDLYQEVILDHGRSPRNFRHPPDASHQARGKNPLRGDMLQVYLTVDEGGVITDAAFEGKGCAISVASASLMTELVLGKSKAQIERLFETFHEMAAGNGDVEIAEGLEDDMDRLQVLSGVKEYPVRVKCATLPWHTMKAALAGQEESTSE